MINPDEPEAAEQIRRDIAAKLGCITQQQFLILTGYTAGTEETKRKRGEAPPYAVVGNTILYPLDTLEVYVKGRVRACRTRPKEML